MASKKQDDSKLTLAVFKQMLTLTTSGLGLVAALAWNNAIQEVVETYIKPFIPNAGLISLILYAVIMTVIAVIVTVNLSKIVEKLER